MIDPTQIQKRNQDLTLLMGEAFRFKANSLARAMQKAGRRLPRHVQKQAALLVEAEQRAGHPKLAKTLNAKDLDRAAKAVQKALKYVDTADARKGLVLSTLGMISFNLIAVAAIVVAVLAWRGLI